MKKNQISILFFLCIFVFGACINIEDDDDGQKNNSSEYYMKATINGTEMVFTKLLVERNWLTEDIEISGSNDDYQVKLVVNDMNTGEFTEADFYAVDESLDTEDPEDVDISEDYCLYLRDDDNSDGEFSYKDNRWGYWGGNSESFTLSINCFESKGELRGSFEGKLAGSYSNTDDCEETVTISNGEFIINSDI